METDKILGEHLREALKQAQQYMVAAITAALLLFVFSRSGSSTVEVGVLGLPETDRPFAIMVALAATLISGCMASWTVARIHFLIDGFKDAETLRAYLSYPSLVTLKISGPRILAAAAPVLLTIASQVLYEDWKLSWDWVVGAIVLFAPFITLTYQLRRTLGGLPKSHHGD